LKATLTWFVAFVFGENELFHHFMFLKMEVVSCCQGLLDLHD